MIGPEGHRPDMTDYRECIKLSEDHVKQSSAAGLEEMNAQKRQAGVTCLKCEEFQKTENGRAVLVEPPWAVEARETVTPPVPFPDVKSTSGKPQLLAGLRVLELYRIIEGPAIGPTEQVSAIYFIPVLHRVAQE